MSANLDHSTGKAAIAFLGSRNDVWHREGQELKPGMSIDQWAEAAGLNWEAIKVPALAALEGPRFDHIEPAKRFAPVEDRFFVVRSDNGHPLGYVSDRYEPVQPREVLEWFERYISVDDRFQLDVAGALKQGEIIWATATFRDPLEVAGDRHVARLLMTTTFDGTGATINQGTMTRTVCQNTLKVSLSDKRAVIRTRHNTKFDAAAVGKELATVAQGFACYKAVGDALAQTEMTKEQVGEFFRLVLEIPLDAKKDEISTRRANQYSALSAAYTKSVRDEGCPANSAWAALNAITRYVDHDTAFSTNNDEKRFISANFGGGGDAIKAKAMELLIPRINDRVAVPA